MSIDQAIENLQQAKAKGVEHIVFAYWDAASFEMSEDVDWPYFSEAMENQMDWSRTHDKLNEILIDELS